MDAHSIFLIKNLLVKTVSSSFCLKLRLPMFLKCFLILPNFSLMFRIEKSCNQIVSICSNASSDYHVILHVIIMDN